MTTSWNTFTLFWQLGIEHITNFAGYDHILFLLSFSITYNLKQWRSLLANITTFTVGHCITLVLATLHIISFPTMWIECAIALTIILSCLITFFFYQKKDNSEIQIFKSFCALLFGLIHGLGFSTYLRSLLGDDFSIVFPLFAFNIGLECGQLLIITISLLFSGVLINRRKFDFIVSGIVLNLAIIMLISRLFV